MIRCVLIFWLALLAGCATFEDVRLEDSLEATALIYERTLRWGNYEDAVLFLRADEVKKQGPDLKRLKRFKITSYETLNRVIQKEQKRAQQTIEIKYYHNQHMIEKTILDKQLWEYHTGDRTWYLLSGLPDFR
jgi:hypothetical protein